MIINERELRRGELPINKIIHGNALRVLKKLPSESVDCIITSPPYWGLRDYGEEANTIWGGDPYCEHEWVLNIKKDSIEEGNIKGFRSGFCKKCGAWFGQLGLEPSLEMYIEHLSEIMKELKRVLKKTGVIFWVHGDSYFTSSPSNKKEFWRELEREDDSLIDRLVRKNSYSSRELGISSPLKCMCLQNYRFILRCIDELGLILRNIIIWHKPNHMPSSVRDRFASAYEPVFMLVKSKRYWFDLDAVRVPTRNPEADFKRVMFDVRGGTKKHQQGGVSAFRTKNIEEVKARLYLGKNPGDVWAISTQPFPDAHFAVYPEKLVETMIKAACPQEICKKCGKARVRIIDKNYIPTRPGLNTGKGKSGTDLDPNKSLHRRDISKYRMKIEYLTVGWTDCGCNAGWESGVVLDPFLGSGTTALVALKFGRRFIGIEINRKYCEMALQRIEPYLGQRKLDEFL